jgi:hypothetical protein
MIKAKIQITDSSRIDVHDFGAIGDGKSHPLSERYKTLADAQADFPHAESLDEELDWAALQSAANQCRDCIRLSLGASTIPIHRTSVSCAPVLFIPPGNYMVNRETKIYPHTSIAGTDWGHSVISLAPSGWAKTAKPMLINGLFIADFPNLPALIWLEADEEWPPDSGLPVANMVNSISRLGLKCGIGAAIYSPGNANQIDISRVWINGYGDGPSGLGVIFNNKSSSTQASNLFFHHNFIEGVKISFLADTIEQGHIEHNQFDSQVHGIYVGGGSNLIISENVFTNAIAGAQGFKFSEGIWVGLGYPCQIRGNNIKDVETSGIKLGGRGTIVADNIIGIKNGNLIKAPGYGIHVVTQAHSFGGNPSVLGGKEGPHSVHDNIIYCDTLPDPPLKSILFESVPTDAIKFVSTNNLDVT